ncbi:MAG: CoA transferase [Herpetosiphonaceae bacterium]|nr:MAG: CoA transferase [Herpetosiphonaceae bacterium]
MISNPEGADLQQSNPASQESAPAALSDLLVLDLTRVLAGPTCTMLLGDFGARIIKVEQPGRGDETRQWGPPFTPSGQSAYFLCANRNKQSITLNLKTEAGRTILRDLARRADVLVENFKAGTMEALDLGYQALRTLNPRLIYCAITGYGQTGPYRDRPGYDTVIQAQGGLMSITGPADGQPYKVGVAIADLLAGLHATAAILAALHYRERSGEGQYIDIALFDAMLGSLANVASAHLISGHPPQRYGNAHATIVPYQPFATADGWLMLAVGNDGQFTALCQALERPEWSNDERFATNPARVANRAVLVPLLEAELRSKPTVVWMEILLSLGVPCGPVNDIPTALADPQAQAREMVQTLRHSADGPLRIVGPVAKLSATPAQITSAPPQLGEHTEEVLRELLGYNETSIAALRAEGAV